MSSILLSGLGTNSLSPSKDFSRFFHQLHSGHLTHTQLLTIQAGSKTLRDWITIPGGENRLSWSRSNLRFGFGILDGREAIKIAASWQNVPPQEKCQVQGQKSVSLGDSARALGMNEGGVVGVSFEVLPGCKVESLEHVEVVVSVEHPRRGELEVVLISPSSTRTRLLGTRPKDTSTNGFSAWPLMSVETWGERPHGSWQLYIADRLDKT